MATTKTTKETKAVAEAKVTAPASLILQRPRITEKAARATTHNTYVFTVATTATKSEIAKAFTAVYKHKPVKVNTVPMASKTVFRRGKLGSTTSSKKAYITLKKGDSIQIM